MEFKARKAQGANPESAGTIRDGIDAILPKHPGVIWHATILVGDAPRDDDRGTAPAELRRRRLCRL